VSLVAGALVAALLLTGCQSGTTAQNESTLPSIAFSMLPTAAASAESSGEDADVTEDEGTDEELPAPACDVDTIAGVEQVVASQLAAFRDRDFEAAFRLASSQFQSFSSVDSLRNLIMDGRHEEVANAASHEFTECRMPEPGRAYAAVSVTGLNRNTVLLVYQFVNEAGEWRILQSAPMGGHRGGNDDLGTAPSAQSA
jgi:hypothetical protein